MQRRQFLAATSANAAAIATLSGCGGGGVAAAHFRLIATDSPELTIRSGLAIADDGTVAFAAVSFGKSSDADQLRPDRLAARGLQRLQGRRYQRRGHSLPPRI